MQHLVLNGNYTMQTVHTTNIWEVLGVLTGVTKLDLGYFRVLLDAIYGCSRSLLSKTVTAMVHLTSLQLSLRVLLRDLNKPIHETDSLTRLVHLQELSILWHGTPVLQICTPHMQSTLQACLRDTPVHVIYLGQ